MDFVHSLGMETISWQQTKGAHGYRDRLYYNGISIHYNGRNDMGVWLEMSGQGCRAFETFGNGNFDDLFSEVKANVGDMHLTRLDVAFDDHEGILDMDKICQDTLAGNFVSPSTYWEVIQSAKGQCVMIGAPSSSVLIRIYDKARERGLTDGTHWIRVELQMRDDRANVFTALPYSFGEKWCGVLLNYLRYVVPTPEDTNKSRWETADYWMNLLWFASALSIYEKPGVEYNIMHCERYVYKMAGNAVDALIRCYGVEEFIKKLEHRKTNPNPKYEQIVDQYKKSKEIKENVRKEN
jgi:phage replication initiation protein